MLTYCGSVKYSGIGCEEMTEHTKLLNNRVRCDICGYEHQMADDDIKARRREISISLSNALGRVMMLKAEDQYLERLLTPIPQVIPDTWARSEFELHCYKCNRVTRWTHRGRAECKDGCPPGRLERTVKGSRKITGDDLPLELRMLLLGGDNIVDMDDAEFEVIKQTGHAEKNNA